MQEGNVPGYQDRRPLFPGGACYPLSGDADNAERVDQLNVIFGVIGTPSKDDIDSIGKATEYIKTMKETKPKPLQELFPAADPAAIDLLQHMLKFNPRHRCTANEALEHGFFTAIRRQDMEKSIDRVLVSPEFLHQAIDIDTLKRNAYNEVLWFRDQSDGPPRSSANSAEKKKQSDGPPRPSANSAEKKK
jgi:mitogen-activated protein kinase 1/3